MSKKIFTDAIIAAYEVLVKAGYYPAISITEDDLGQFAIYWCGFNGSLNTLSYWTDENIGLYGSYVKGITLHEEELTADDFFNLCYKSE